MRVSGFPIALLCHQPDPMSGARFAAPLGICDNALESNAHLAKGVIHTDSAKEQRVEGPDGRAGR